MTAQTNAAFSAQPGNTYLNGIWWNTEWVTNGNAGGPVTITYAYSSTYTLNSAEQTAVQQVFADISAICGITFVAGNEATADLILNSGTGAQLAAEMGGSNTALGIADPPGTYINPTTGDEQSWVFINEQQYSANGLNKGGYDYVTWQHEIGHALGLAHPHDAGGGSSIYPGVTGPFGSLGTDQLNQGIYTTMSYNDGWSPFNAYNPKQFGWQATMMAFDIAALQLKYGANNNYATGSNTYILRDTAGIGSFAQCIWDAGGNDTMYYGGAYGASVDLRAATLTSGPGAGGFVSYVYGTGTAYSLFTIANGAVIENALTGSGADSIVGNDASNFVMSGEGADTILLLGNSDFAAAGGGNDVIYGGSGYDNLLGGTGFDAYFGGSENDYFNLATDVVSGEYDILYDLVPGSDYVLIPSAAVVAFAYANVGPNAYCYALLPNSTYYVFIALGITAAQLQSQTIAY